MKRFLLHTVLFLLGTAVLYLPAVWLAGKSGMFESVKYIPNNYGFSDLRLNEADKLCLSNGPDVVFVGSSHCYRTFDTRIWDSVGLRSFNLGSSNQTPRQTCALLERYLKHWSPQLVIIEVHPDIMGINGDESAIDLISNTYIDTPMRQMALGQKRLQVFNTMCCSLVDRALHCGRTELGDSIRNIATKSGDTTLTVDFKYVSGGYVEVTPYCYKTIPLRDKTITISNEQMHSLEMCLWLLDSHSTPYMLVEVPSTRSRYLSYTNHSDFENKIRSLVDMDSEYLNLNEDRQLMLLLSDSTCFFDDDHLNQHGAEIVTEYLLKCI